MAKVNNGITRSVKHKSPAFLDKTACVQRVGWLATESRQVSPPQDMCLGENENQHEKH